MSRRSRILRAAALAGVLSGAPSTVHALATGESPLAASRAAGALTGRPGLVRGAFAHTVVSLWWVAALDRVLPRRQPIAWGLAAGGAIAALDLWLVGRRIPAIRALPVAPQVADHLAFGVLAAVSLRARGRSTSDQLSTPRRSGPARSG
ncbi:MAG: hypothetical protein S0880_01800 [Actinomycetota bacterium]|nr:hypothetical protein [Actinomycetota bacterium]